MIDYNKTPWPWFGGKADAAPYVWEALGDVPHYVEPFAGSLAVLLRRPHPCNRAYYSETVNDADGLLCNAWRSMIMSPQAMAEAASWPVCEADLHARHLALVRWREERNLERLMADPHWHDPVMAGWWVWGQCCWIGGGWCSGTGPWTVDADGRIFKQGRAGTREPGVWRTRPNLSNNGRGVNHAGTREPGVRRQLPHLSNDGMGVNHAGTREPGVLRQLPHVSDDGRGVNHAGVREPGVLRKLPHVSNDGRGVNHAGTREPGVKRTLPHLSNDGMGVNRPLIREPGVERKRPHLSNDGMGVNHAGTREPGVGEYHPMTMPELRNWFEFLAARLRHVRVVNGDWSRVCTNGALKSLPVRKKTGACGVFLDPPYSGDVRDKGIYSCEDYSVASAVREWCIANGGDEKLRIVLAGFDTEHSLLVDHGWREVEWYKSGFLKGGMGNLNQSGGGSQQKRERLWLSPHCLVGQNSEPEFALTAIGAEL